MNHTNTIASLLALTEADARSRYTGKCLALFANALLLVLATVTNPARAALVAVSPTQTSINVATGGTYTFAVTGSVGEAVTAQSLFCSSVGVTVPANGIVVPAAGVCTPSSVTPINPVSTAGTLYSFTGSITAAQAATMLSEAIAVGQPAGSRFVYWRQGFSASGFAIVRVNLIEPVAIAPTLLPADVNFGNVQVGQTSAPRFVTLNTGSPMNNQPVTISHPSWTVASTTCPNVLTANLISCQVTMSCAPTGAGTLSAPVSVTVGTFTVSSTVSCTGVVPPPPIVNPTLSPASADFGSITVGATSAPAFFVLLNPSATALNVTMTVPPGFARLNPSFCTTVPANNSCGIQLVFTPTAAQPYSGVFAVTAGSTSLSSTLSGLGTAPPLPPTLLPASASFGSVTVGSNSAPQIFTLSNRSATSLSGLTITVPAGFTQSSNCGNTLAVNGTCQITVTFAPSAAQNYGGALSVTAGSTNLSSGVSGNGIVAPPPPPVAVPTLLPASASFGSVTVGSNSAPQNFTLSNPGATSLSGLTIVAPTGFTQVSNCGSTLAANGNCQITVTFTPQSAQIYSGVLAITAGANSLSSGVSGIGTAAPPPPPVAPPSLLPASAGFGSVTVGTSSAPQVLTLSNPGSSAISGLTIVAPSGFTQLSNCGTTLSANGNCQITVTFAPTAAQTYGGLLVVTAGATTLSSSVSGVGAPVPPPVPVVMPSLLPATANFGSVTVGATAVTQIFTLSNPGNTALTGLNISLPPGFSQSSNCGSLLAALANCQIAVAFAPTAAQAYSGSLIVASGATNLSSSVTGVGTAAPFVGTASTLTDVSPKRVVGNVSSDLTQVLSYTFSGNTSSVSPGDGLFCLDLIVGLPAGNTTTGNPCTNGSQFARHPTVSGAFQSTRVGSFIRSVRETIRVPSAVSRFARENGRSRYYFARQFSPNQYAVVAIELLGNVANQPISITDMRMYFKQGGEQPIVFLKRGDALPTVEAKLVFTGSGWLRGAWEVVQPGDLDPTESDLMTDASLPLSQRGLQRRYTVVGTFQQYLPAIGQVTLTPPDLSRFPVRADGAYRVLLRLFADPAIGADNEGRLASGAAAFALPTARYFVGSFASHGTTSTLPSISVSLPSVNHVFAATEAVSFRWQATRDAAVYLLEAVDATGKLVAAAQVPASAVELNTGYSAPAPWRAQATLGAGAVRWRVTAYSRDGEALARSDWRGVRF